MLSRTVTLLAVSHQRQSLQIHVCERWFSQDFDDEKKNLGWQMEVAIALAAFNARTCQKLTSAVVNARCCQQIR